jgi:hypothetical protein
MLSALLLALAPVVVGAVVGLVPAVGRRFVQPVKVLAVLAAAAVAVLHLLPEAYAQAGPLVLASFAVGVALPLIVEKAAHRPRTARFVGADLAFVGVALHQAVDGLQIGAAGHLDPDGGWAIAVALHVAPLVAATTLDAAERGGAKQALRRAGVLLVCTALGVLGGNLAGGLAVVGALQPWALAAVGGALLHVAVHDLKLRSPAAST